ncbi:MAG: FecR family protein [Desulfobacterales bacterium]|nr:FecR family protein [Desulfobacterales bacterium]
MKPFCILLFLFLFFLPEMVTAQPHAAMVKSVSGKVTIQRQIANQNQYKNQSAFQTFPAQVGMLLQSGDVIVTAYKGYAGIMFTDGTVITLGPKTSFGISNYIFSPETAAYDFLFYLERGEAVYHSGKIGKLSPESVKVSTPKATVGIRGTRFIIKVD